MKDEERLIRALNELADIAKRKEGRKTQALLRKRSSLLFLSSQKLITTK